MNQIEEKLLREYCGHLLVNYGFEILPSDPILPALYIINRELSSNVNANNNVAMSMQEALKRLSPTVYNFNTTGEGWKFALASSLKWLFIGLSIIGVVGVCNLWWRQYNDVSISRNIIMQSPYISSEILKRIKKNEEGFLYLEFKKSDDAIITSAEEYDQVSKSTIRVYFGRPK